jgi:GTP-binding protein
VVNRELERYDAELAKRPQVVALSKLDVTETRAAYPALKDAFAARGITLHAVSAATGEGVREVLEEVWRALQARDPSAGLP